MSELLPRLKGALSQGYRIERELGRGGMATVFLAEELKHHRRVAIKVLDPEVAAVIGVDRFQREISTLARLTHPNILTFHDSGSADGLLFYVMPFIEGESLRDRLNREPQLPLAEAVRIAAEVARGLDYAHAHDVVHRDIKPENILLSQGQAVIADFGVARAVEHLGGGKLTGTGVVIGTPAYMSPEQVAAGRTDGRSDLYSLGCVVHEMLVGQAPFTGPSSMSLAHQHLSVPPPPVSSLRPGLPAPLDAALLRALAKTPVDRFASAGEFAAALVKAASAPAHAAEPTPIPRPTPPRRPLMIVVALAVLAVVAAGIWVLGRRGGGEIESIAVLPLENLSGDESQVYFADGMTEELITELSKIGSLRVISRSSVASYRASKKPSRQVGHELGVQAVVEGAVLRVENRVRVSARLVHAAEDRQLWADQYERDFRDVLALQGEVARAIAGRIRGVLSPEIEKRLSHGAVRDTGAYEDMLRARYLMRKLTEKGLQEAVRLFDAAVERDPSSAPAWAGEAEALYYMSNIYAPARQVMPRVRTCALKALELDPELADAHGLLAIVQAHYDWDWAAGEKSVKQAIALNPSLASARLFHASILSETGRHDQALVEFAKVLELDPLSDYAATVWNQAPYLAGHYDDVIARCQAMLKVEPDYYPTESLLGLCYLQQNRIEDAVRLHERAVAAADQPFPLGLLGYSYAVGGRRADAERVLRQLAEASRTQFVPDYCRAIVHVGLGDLDRAFEWLGKGIENRDENIAPLMVDPLFAGVRSDPRFLSLLRRMGLGDRATPGHPAASVPAGSAPWAAAGLPARLASLPVPREAFFLSPTAKERP